MKLHMLSIMLVFIAAPLQADTTTEEKITEVISVKWIPHQVHSDHYLFTLAGFGFSLYRSVSGPAK